MSDTRFFDWMKVHYTPSKQTGLYNVKCVSGRIARIMFDDDSYLYGHITTTFLCIWSKYDGECVRVMDAHSSYIHRYDFHLEQTGYVIHHTEKRVYKRTNNKLLNTLRPNDVGYNTASKLYPNKDYYIEEILETIHVRQTGG